MNYARPWKSFAEQLELLKARGMAIGDEAAAASYLSRIGYYRLSAYWYPFRIWSMQQEAGTGRITHQRTDAFQDNIVEQPKLPAHGEIAWCDAFAGNNDLLAKPLLLLAICRHVVRRICPGTAWHVRLAEHLRSFPEQRVAQQRSVIDMGTPPNWESWW